MSRSRALVVFGIVALSLICFSWSPASRRLRAVQMLDRLSGSTMVDAPQPIISTRDVDVPSGAGFATHTRLYWRTDRPKGRGIVLAHGVHHAGIEERRLVAFARSLADAGMVVSTPQLRDLADYRITGRGVTEIRAAVTDLSTRRDLVDTSRVGLIGFSFAGGLSLVAATDPALEPHLAYVVSVGGHHRLDRVLRFFVTDRIDTPDGPIEFKAHDYGLVVLLHGHVDKFVPEEDRDVLSEALRAWLQEDRDTARELAKRCKTAVCTSLFAHVADDTLEVIGPRVMELIADNQSALNALSPAGRLHDVPVPIYLLHGSSDTVIPATEVAWAERELAGRDYRAIVTPLIDHVEVSKQATWWDKVELVDFMSALL